MLFYVLFLQVLQGKKTVFMLPYGTSTDDLPLLLSETSKVSLDGSCMG